MRLDKYLKVSRLIKRRTVAKEAAETSRIEVNHVTSKPSKEIKIGDIITLHLGKKVIEIQVTSLEQKKDILMFDLLKETTRP
jgi:ribosomal 50S subunit-recycling heat shock protein